MISRKNIPASVMARLKNVSRDLSVPFNLVMQLYIQERLLYRLSLSKYKNKFLLKGGLLLYSMNEFKGRPTKDIDFLAKNISNDLDSIENAIKEICSFDIEDGVNYDLESIITNRIKEDADYQGVRIKIISFIGKAKVHIQIDIGFGDLTYSPPIHYRS